MTTSHDRRKIPNRRRWKLLVIPAAAAGLAALAACGSSGSSSHAPVTAGSLRVAHLGTATVLTNTKGFTLYSFAPDTPNKSNCNAACAVKWPPVKGHAPASGIKGTFTAIKRSDGSTQETFNGHPLYTFVGDKAPGQANGNGINAFGGLWHEITTSGIAATSGPASTGSGASGY